VSLSFWIIFGGVMNISEQKFEEWRKEQIESLVRMGYLDAARAFRDLGSVQWAGWQAAWKASREAIVIDRVSDELYGMNSTEIVRCVNDEWCEMLEEQGIR
jgi:hypothetical protein